MIKSTITGTQETKAAIEAALKNLTDGAQDVLVGFPEGSGSYNTGETIAGVAAANEFGTETIPQRSFLRPGVDSGVDLYTKIIEENSQAVLDGEMTTDQVLNQIGAVAAAKVKEFIINLSTPANAESTVKKKKSSNPLIDTGNMVQSVTHVISPVRPEEGI